MKHHFTVLAERDEDGYLVATVPALKSCYTQARRMDELMPGVREVIQLCLDEEEPVQMTVEKVERNNRSDRAKNSRVIQA